MSFYDIINCTVGEASAEEIQYNLCLRPLPPQPHTCSNCDHSNDLQENLTSDQSYEDTLLKPYGQCFLTSAAVFIEDFQGKTRRGSNFAHQVEQHSDFYPSCICFNCYSLCEKESFEPCLLDCDLQIEETKDYYPQSWQEWSMLTRRSPTPSIGTKCPES